MEAKDTRIAWIDHARGLCIVLVVMLYATEWVEGASQGWLRTVTAFAEPFRMPDFFLLSGLLLSRTIGRPWPLYLDRKVLHFAYFYVLWLVIAFAVLGESMADDTSWGAVGRLLAESLVRPFYWLWFIYMLPLFFVVTKLVARAPAALVWTIAAALQIAPPETDVKVLDKFASYYVFFYSGYVLAPLALRVAAAADARPASALAALAAWAVLEALAASAGYTRIPGVSLVLAFLGIAAVVAAAALMQRRRAFDWLRFCGQRSLVIYLAFFAPAIVTRSVLSRIDLIGDPGIEALVVTAAGVAGALLTERLVRGTRLEFLFVRPAWLRLDARPAAPRARHAVP